MKASHVHLSFGAALRGWLVGLFVCVFSLSSHAVTWNNTTNFLWQTNGNISSGVPGAGSGAIIHEIKPNALGGVNIGGQKALPWHPTPDQYDKWASWKSPVKSRELAKSLISPRNPLGGLAIGIVGSLVINQLLDEACVRLSGGEKELRPGAAFDECVPVLVLPTDVWTANPVGGVTLSDTTVSGLCTKAKPYASSIWPAQNGWKSWTPVTVGDRCFFDLVDTGGNKVRGELNIVKQKLCSDGKQPTNGKCAEGTTWEKATPESAEAKVAAKFSEWTQQDFATGYDPNNIPRTSQIVQSVLQRGGEVETEPMTVTGPASIPQTPVVTHTTNNNGDTITKTETTTNNYKYEGNKVTQTTSVSTVTQTCTGAGACSTTTEKTDDERESCEKNPDSLACATTDTPEGEIPRSEKQITYTPEDPGFGGGSCPPDRAIGQEYSFSFAPTCNIISSYVKPMVLVIAGFMALMIVFGIRSEM